MSNLYPIPRARWEIPGRSPFLGERRLETHADLFFFFFPRNPLKFHKMTKEKLAESKEMFAHSKKMFADSKETLGKKSKDLEAFPRF